MAIESLYFLGPIMILLIFVVLAFIIFFFIAWIWMVVDCIKRDFKEGSERIAWVLVLVFIPLIGLILYYFIVFIKDKKRKSK